MKKKLYGMAPYERFFFASLLVCSLGSGACSKIPPSGDDLAVPPTADLAMPTDMSTGLDGRSGFDLGIPITILRNPSYLVVLGDAIAGGYNAAGLNGNGGKGYARLLLTNHSDYPAYAGHDLRTPFPGVQFVDMSRTESTVALTRANLERDLSMMALPPSIVGDLVVLIHAGSFDFFSDTNVMLDATAVRNAAASVRMNLGMMITLLKMRYEKPTQAVIVLVDNIIDPTDGTGLIPSTYTTGLCMPLQSTEVQAAPDKVAANLAYLNGEIAAEIAARGAYLVDARAALLGHGMNAGAARYIDDGCSRLLNAGHEALRRQAWKVLTGDSF